MLSKIVEFGIFVLFFSDRAFVTERMETSEGPTSAGPHGRTPVIDDVSISLSLCFR